MGDGLRWCLQVARRIAIRVAVAYVVVVALFHGVMAVGVAVSRLDGRRPRPPASIAIENLRRVDDRVWASAAPDPRHYRALAEAGVELMVNLRTEESDDRTTIDEAALADLGIDYVRLPVRDGHVPTDTTVRRFRAVVDGHRGVVLVHCGAGVGRSSTLAAGHLSAEGEDISLWDTLALGSVTLDQAWFLSTGARNHVITRFSEALDAPRRAWSRATSIL